jgi:hypothetical protein
MRTEHKVASPCNGEKCRCGEAATHKIAEEIQGEETRHPLTAYVCCLHFNTMLRAWLDTDKSDCLIGPAKEG